MKQRNYSMDVFRFFAALLVVVCHVDFMVEGPEAVYLFVARFMPRITLGFFFGMSGYFYLQALEAGKDVFKKQFKSLLKVYIVWSLIYYMASFVMNVIIEGDALGQFIIERIVFFLTRGSYSHFWFFPAIIYSLILATICYKISHKHGLKVLTVVSVLLFLFGNLGSAYYEIGIKIPLISTIITEHRDGFEVFRGIFCMGLPYFMIGYILNKCEGWIAKTGKIKLFSIMAVVIALYCLEIVVLSCVLKWYQYPEVFLGLYPTALAIMMCLIKCPKPAWKPYANSCKRMSGYVYYVHPLLILVIKMLAGICGVYVTSVVMYIAVISIALISGWILMKLNGKIKWISYLL